MTYQPTPDEFAKLKKLFKTDLVEAEFVAHKMLCKFINSAPERLQDRLWEFNRQLDDMRDKLTDAEFSEYIAAESKKLTDKLSQSMDQLNSILEDK